MTSILNFHLIKKNDNSCFFKIYLTVYLKKIKLSTTLLALVLIL